MDNSVVAFWNTVQRDDILFKIEQVYQFYSKKPPTNSGDIWLSVLRPYHAEDIIRAFDNYYHHGKYCPKPSDIVSELDGIRSHRKGREPHEPIITSCPEEVARAWQLYMYKIHGFKQGTPVEMDWDDVLTIINKSAVKSVLTELGKPLNDPDPSNIQNWDWLDDCIAPQYLIPEIWENSPRKPAAIN